MRFSLIVTTRDGERTRELLRLLDSLAGQSHKDFEVVLVYQTTRPELPSHVSSAIEALPASRIVLQPLLPVSKARNEGLKVARHSVVGFPDDDAWYPPELLHEVSDLFETCEGLGFACVNVRDPKSGLTYGNRPYDTSRCRITRWKCHWLPVSTGLFVHRERCTTVVFDEALGAGNRWGSGEETDLVYRLVASGADGFYYGWLNVFHSVNLGGFRTDVTKSSKYALGYGAMLARQMLRGFFWPGLLAMGWIVSRGLGGLIVALAKRDIASIHSYAWRTVSVVRGACEGWLSSVSSYPAGLSRKL